MEPLKAFDRSLFGGSPTEVPEVYRRSSPLTYVADVRGPRAGPGRRQRPALPDPADRQLAGRGRRSSARTSRSTASTPGTARWSSTSGSARCAPSSTSSPGGWGCPARPEARASGPGGRADGRRATPRRPARPAVGVGVPVVGAGRRGRGRSSASASASGGRPGRRGGRRRARRRRGRRARASRSASGSASRWASRTASGWAWASAVGAASSRSASARTFSASARIRAASSSGRSLPLCRSTTAISRSTARRRPGRVPGVGPVR